MTSLFLIIVFTIIGYYYGFKHGETSVTKFIPKVITMSMDNLISRLVKQGYLDQAKINDFMEREFPDLKQDKA